MAPRARHGSDGWVTVLRLTRRQWIGAGVWTVGLIVLVVVLAATGVNTTVFGGVLGAWCGIALVFLFRAIEARAPSDSSETTPMLRERYGRR
jgi:hypothetical protein